MSTALSIAIYNISQDRTTGIDVVEWTGFEPVAVFYRCLGANGHHAKVTPNVMTMPTWRAYLAVQKLLKASSIDSEPVIRPMRFAVSSGLAVRERS